MNGTLPAAVAALSQVPAVEAVTERFTAAGKRLYAVGGCMRDALTLSDEVIESPDIDFTTDADPDTIIQILNPLGAIWDAGARFGTIGVAIPDGKGGYEKIEVTTHRAETYEESSRKPSVMLVTDIDEDLARRDLTINSIALRLTPGPLEIIDPFGGAQDLDDRVLRTPADPRRTLDEDPLRILRVIRFAARFGFAIDTALVAACIEFAGRLEIVAAERRTDELRKILDLGGERCVTAFELAEKFGVTSFLLGGVAMTDQLRKALTSLGGAGLVLTAVAADSFLNGSDGNARLRTCRLTNQETAPAVTVGRLVASGTLNASDIVSVRATIRKFGTDATADAILVSEAFDKPCREFSSAFAAVILNHPEVATTALPVNGDDALAAGLKGRAVGEALSRVEASFCADPDLSREAALALLR